MPRDQKTFLNLTTPKKRIARQTHLEQKLWNFELKIPAGLGEVGQPENLSFVYLASYITQERDI